MKLKPISVSLSPNTQKDDVLLAFKTIFSFNWKQGRGVKKVEKKFKEYLNIGYAFSFNSGRSSLMAILKGLQIKKGDQIILQAFTCSAAINPILKLEALPVFCDIDETLNLDPLLLEEKITSKTKAVMIQHTFGWPAKIEEIKKICQKHNLYLIEDCAHSLGAEYRGRLVGTFSDAAFFSFGRDKIISSVYGGMAVCNNVKIAGRIKRFQEEIGFPSNRWIFQQLLHPVLMNWIVLPFYNLFKIGRGALAFFLNSNLLSKAVVEKEGKGKMPDYFPKRLPNALAVLALKQFDKLEIFNAHRREIAKVYDLKLKEKSLPSEEEDIKAVFMKYPIFVKDSDKLIEKLKERGIFLNDGWRKSAIVPPKTCLAKLNYKPGSCKKAEEVAKHIVVLPTHINISKQEALEIIQAIGE